MCRVSRTYRCKKGIRYSTGSAARAVTRHQARQTRGINSRGAPVADRIYFIQQISNNEQDVSQDVYWQTLD